MEVFPDKNCIVSLENCSISTDGKNFIVDDTSNSLKYNTFEDAVSSLNQELQEKVKNIIESSMLKDPLSKIYQYLNWTIEEPAFCDRGSLKFHRRMNNGVCIGYVGVFEDKSMFIEDGREQMVERLLNVGDHDRYDTFVMHADHFVCVTCNN